MTESPRCAHDRLMISNCEKCERQEEPGHRTNRCGMTTTECQRSGGCAGRLCDPFDNDDGYRGWND